MSQSADILCNNGPPTTKKTRWPMSQR